MAQTVRTRSELIEEEYSGSVTQLIGIIVLFFALLLTVYLLSLWHSNPVWSMRLRILVGAGALITLGWAIVVGMKMQKTKAVKTLTVNCPYCDFPMEFLEQPNSDYDCENCHRRVQYENGRPVPIKTVTCQFCKTVHKVSVNAKHFLCDRCNRPVKLSDDPKEVVAEQSDMLANYDVVLTDVGRKSTDVAMALESILICNLVEARRQMENLPLTVMRNVPERKADAVRRRLRDLGATAVIRPTADDSAGGRR